jgi:hypothetical protein
MEINRVPPAQPDRDRKSTSRRPTRVPAPKRAPASAEAEDRDEPPAPARRIDVTA